MADQLLQERRTFPPYQGKVEICHLLEPFKGFPGISDDKEAACNAEDLSLIPGSGRCPGEGNGCLGNPMDGEAWWIQSMGSQKDGHD